MGFFCSPDVLGIFSTLVLIFFLTVRIKIRKRFIIFVGEEGTPEGRESLKKVEKMWKLRERYHDMQHLFSKARKFEKILGGFSNKKSHAVHLSEAERTLIQSCFSKILEIWLYRVPPGDANELSESQWKCLSSQVARVRSDIEWLTGRESTLVGGHLFDLREYRRGVHRLVESLAKGLRLDESIEEGGSHC